MKHFVLAIASAVAVIFMAFVGAENVNYDRLTFAVVMAIALAMLMEKE